MLMDKNPELSFALEESFPFKSTYDQATPLGPIMELRSPDAQTVWSPETAASVVDYWRIAVGKVLAYSERPPDAPERKAYSEMASAQAALLAEHGLQAEAEQTYQLAAAMAPGSPKTVFSYVQALLKVNKSAEAIAIAEAAFRAAPQNENFSDLARNIAAATRP
jgi:tetratricopeptide (TPR) repeat protein